MTILWHRCSVMLSFLQRILTSLHCVTLPIQIKVAFLALPDGVFTEIIAQYVWLVTYKGSQFLL